jgi:hypothetical protein
MKGKGSSAGGDAFYPGALVRVQRVIAPEAKATEAGYTEMAVFLLRNQ